MSARCCDFQWKLAGFLQVGQEAKGCIGSGVYMQTVIAEL